MSKIAIDRIKDDRGAGMTDVAEVIDRYAADIHPHLFFMEGNEILFLTGQRVVDAKGHRSKI
jgi:hypothetical protein